MWTKLNPRGWEQCPFGSLADQGNESSSGQSSLYH